MSVEESKRQRVCNMINTRVHPQKISSGVGASLRTVYNVKNDNKENYLEKAWKWRNQQKVQ